MIRYLSCFSGIEAASVAWQPLGWKCVGVAEVEPFPCAVLAHHYPDVPNLGDVMADDFLQRASALRPDVLVGGPPCQDFSVAGLRAGIGGDRGNLSLRWVEIVRAIRPAYAVTENVPGWLSVNGGHAFGAFLAGLVGHDTALVPPRQCGGRWTNAGMVAGPIGRVAWRVMDAQFFNLAQRRQRVFVVFCPRDGADPAAVLFERKGVQGHSPPRREAGKGAAGTLSSRSTAGGGLGTDFECSGGVVQAAISSGRGWWDTSDVGATVRAQDSANKADTLLIARCLNAHPNRSPFVTVAPPDGFDASEDGTGRRTPLVACEPIPFDPRQIHHPANFSNPKPGDVCHPLRGVGNCEPAIAVSVALRGREGGGVAELGGDCAHALRSSQGGGDKPHVLAFDERQSDVIQYGDQSGGRLAVQTHAAVRRLVPEEAEALQGFPRGYTLISYRGKPAADGPRYRALGNSMAVPCMAWIGSRIAAQEAEIRASQQAAA